MTYVPLDELPEFARNVRAMLKLLPKKDSAVVVYLNGDLGAGKTTFVKALARELEVQEEVQSPTYVLMKKYELPNNRTSFGAPRRFKRLIHIDAYRLEGPQEFGALKPEEFLNDPDALVLVEWPERIDGALPPADLVMSFSASGVHENVREIEAR